MQRLTMKEDGNAQTGVLDDPRLQKVSALGAHLRRRRIASREEFPKERIGTKTVAGDFPDFGVIQRALVEDGRQLDRSEGRQIPSSFELSDLFFNGHPAQ